MMNDGVRTAGIIIIGNEILSGKVQDINSYYLATELRSLGIEVRKISVIPDEVGLISKEVKGFSDSYDHVFTTGGVGPTHDDVTMAGIAKGFNVRLTRSREIKDFLFRRYGNDLNGPALKMAEVPEGSEVICFDERSFPLVLFRNIFIFPGIPDHLKKKFAMIKERFRTKPFYLKRLFLNARESDIADSLNMVVEENRGVIFGSYPVIGNPQYSVMVTAESKSEDSLSKALKDLIKLIPDDVIVNIEDNSGSGLES